MEKKFKRLIVAVDFDGTLVEDEFPEIGSPIEGAFETCKKIQDLGGRLILWTNRDGEYLKEAEKFCKEQGVKFDAVCDNVSGLDFVPYPKVLASVYIDDKGNSLIPKSVNEMKEIWDEINSDLDSYEEKEEGDDEKEDMVEQWLERKFGKRLLG